MIQRALFARWREDALAIFTRGVQAVRPETVLPRWLHPRRDGIVIGRQPFAVPGRLWVLGAGKAAAQMAAIVETLLGDRIAGGLVVTKTGHARPLKRLEVIEAAHPIPDEGSVRAAHMMVKHLQALNSDDRVLFLLSGGASALLEWPAEGLTLEDVQCVTDALLRAGATIHEINAVRKHLSRIKGGQLVRWAHPTPVWTLAISDVVGNDPTVIGSGPTVPDPSTYADAIAVLQRFRLWESVPVAVRRHLEAGVTGQHPETPKPSDPVFRLSRFWIVADNQQSLLAAAREARHRGYHTLIITSFLEGDVEGVAAWVIALARQIFTYGQPLRPPACVLMGGETTVQVRGKGRGGRNQELAVRVGRHLAPDDPVVFLSGGTDGTDGPTDAAGGLVDGWRIAQGRRRGLVPDAFLAENNTYPYLKAIGGLIKTGPTHTNVMDLMVLLVGIPRAHLNEPRRFTPNPKETSQNR